MMSVLIKLNVIIGDPQFFLELISSQKNNVNDSGTAFTLGILSRNWLSLQATCGMTTLISYP